MVKALCFIRSLLLACFAFIWISTNANVIGVDLGVDYMKVSLVAPRKPMEIVTNLASKRKTEVAVNVANGERSFGSDAELLLTRKPMSTFTKFTTLLGRGPDHPVVKAYQGIGLPTDVFFNETSGRYNFRVTEKGAETLYSPEEIVSMVLTHAKDITKVFGYTVKDMVVTVPEFATYMERRGLQDAATLSGSTLLSLVDENTAAAIQLCIDAQHEKDYTVLIYNMGANSVQVTIVTFGPKMVKGKNVGQLTVKGKGWDSTMGASWMDLALVDKLAQQFNKKWGKGDVRKFERPMGKIRAQARKVKEVLSANKEIPVTLSSLHEDIDFTTSVTRAEFEEALKPILPRVTAPIDMALKMAGMTLDDINEVELVGGGVRIPKVQEVLKDYFAQRKDDKGDAVLGLGIHLNGDEAMALGAVFRGANISRNFQVRPVGLTDITPFAVDISLRDIEAVEEAAAAGVGSALKGMFGGGGSGGGAAKKVGNSDGDDVEGEEKKVFSKNMNLYEAGTSLPFKKSVALTHSADLLVNVTYAPPEDNPYLPEGTPKMLMSYKVTGVVGFAEKMIAEGFGEPKVTLKFVTDASGLTLLSSAEAHVEYDKEVTYEELVEVEDDGEEDEKVEAAAAGKKEVGGETKEEGTAASAAAESEGEMKKEKEESEETSKGDDDNDGDDDQEGEGDAQEEGDASDGDDEKEPQEGEVGEGEANDDEEESGGGGGDKDGDDEETDDAKKTKGSNDSKKSKSDSKKSKKGDAKGIKDEKKKKKKVSVTKTKTVKDKKKQTLKIEENFEFMTVRPLSKEETKEGLRKIDALNKADQIRKDKEEAKNSLESYILSVRNSFYDKEEALSEVSTSDMREDVIRVANELESWLYDDGWDEDAPTYRAKKLELSKLAEKIFTRLDEKTARPEAVKSAQLQLQKVREKMDEWAQNRPWITEEERTEMIELVAKVESWLKEKSEAQALLKGHEDAAFMAADVAPQLKPVKNLLAKLGKKPAPKVEKEEGDKDEDGEEGEGKDKEKEDGKKGEGGTDEEEEEGGGGAGGKSSKKGKKDSSSSDKGKKGQKQKETKKDKTKGGAGGGKKSSKKARKEEKVDEEEAGDQKKYEGDEDRSGGDSDGEEAGDDNVVDSGDDDRDEL